MDPLYGFDDSDPRLHQLWYQQIPTAQQPFQVNDGVSGVEQHPQNPHSPHGPDDNNNNNHHHHHHNHSHHQHQQSQAPQPQPVYHQPSPVTTATTTTQPHAAASFFQQDWPFPSDIHYPFAQTYPQTTQSIAPWGYMALDNQNNQQHFPMGSTDSPQIPMAYATHVVPTNPLTGFSAALQNDLASFASDPNGFAVHSAYSTSPNSSLIDIHSTASSDSGGYYLVPTPSRDSFESDIEPGFSTVNHPGRTLRIQTPSGSSPSDKPVSPASTDSFDEVPFPIQSPPLASIRPDLPSNNVLVPEDEESPTPRPSRRRQRPRNSSNTKKESTSTSPPLREKAMATFRAASSSTKKTTTALATRKESASSVRKTGRRKGPLRPEQREQAGQIRKLRACIRCKFLKKTCDVGDPCQGCKPHHVRNWIVPCARIDIKDVSYFMKNWTMDFDRHITPQTSFVNIRHYSPVTRSLWVTHGFGYVLPIDAREVWVYDVSAFDVDWWETQSEPKKFTTATAELSAGQNGVSLTRLSEYLDRHVDIGFVRFVTDHFDGTPFLSELLMSAHKYYKQSDNALVRKALKFVVAYNLTLHITLIEGLPEDVNFGGKIDDPESKFFGKTLAPGMINMQIKFAMAKIWRDLHNEVLDGLSKLLTGVYSGDKLKNWPTIFVVTALLLVVWEEMQFDTKFRKDTNPGADTFCSEMEGTPLGVIVGLFAAVSQKVPAFYEWDTEQHHHILNSNQSACDLMTEVRDHITHYDDYLRERKEAKFDPQDFDSLSNSFLSKLVIRAN